MKHQRFDLTRATAVWAAAVLMALPSTAERKRFEESVDVVTVEVPVQVVAGGRPVRGLTAESFEILAGKKRQELTGFEVIDLDQVDADASTTALPTAARRHFLLLFDLSFSQPDGIVKSRTAAYELVEEGLHPTDLVGVATYTLNAGPRLVLGFTPDRQQLAAALDDLGLQQYSQRQADPLGLVVDLDPVLRPPGQISEAPAGGGGRGPGINGPALTRQHLADLSVATARVSRELAIDRARAYTSSFEELAGLLRAVRGRKQVVLFSEGFDATAILGTQSADRTIETARDATRGEYWKVDSDERFGSTSTLGFLDSMLEAFRRADAVIQSIDVGGARTSGRSEAAGSAAGLATSGATQGLASATENSLFVMANETGGELYRNFNDLETAMGQLLERTAVTYVLSFTPKKLPEPGGFERLQVRLKNAPKSARALHKPGYFAPMAYRDQSGLVRQLRAADLVLDSADGGDIAVTTWAVPAGHGDAAGDHTQRREVLVFLDVEGDTLLVDQEHDIARFRIFAYAIDREGRIGDFMTQHLELDLDRVERTILDGGMTFFGRLHVPAGSYRIRTVVQDAYSGRHGTRTARVTVPIDQSALPSLAPPLFPLVEGAGLLLVENDRRHVADEYPLRSGETAFVPRARLAAGATVPVQIAAYAKAGATLDAWLESSSGERVDDVIETSDGLAMTDDASLRAQLEVSAGALQPGRYTLRLELHDGSQVARSSGVLLIGGP